MEIHTGKSDKKSYRLVTLDNGLEALLIHEDVDESAEPEDDDGGSSGFETEEEGDDDDASDDGDDESDGDDGPGPQRAAAAMVVGVGSWADPPETQGCAHFLEHLLFLGTFPARSPRSFCTAQVARSTPTRTPTTHSSVSTAVPRTPRPASCGRHDFREILTGKTMKSRHRRNF